jgi:hypothetical protein
MPVSQPIGNVIAAARTSEIKLPPFEEDMPQASYNQAEAYFCLHGVTDWMFWFYYIQWVLTPVQKKLARDILYIPDLPPNAYELLKEQLLRLYDKRLTSTMQSMLGENDTSSIPDLAAWADALMDAEAAKDHAIAAAMEEATVAATGVAPPSSTRKRKPEWNKKKKPAAKKHQGDGDRPDPGPWQDLGLCWSHYTYGNKAKKRKLPCARAEN